MGVWYVGIDWGSETHAVCVTDGHGKAIAERELSNDGRFVERLFALAGPAEDLQVAVESKDLPFVDMLVEAGCAVFTINPKQAERFRDRRSCAGAKDDARDARTLASALRTDGDAFRRVEPDDPAHALLRVRVRAAEVVKEQQRVAANQLGATLGRYFPALLSLCPGADEPWLWRLLAKQSCPERAARLSLPILESILRRSQVRKISAEQLRETLRAKRLRASPGVARGCAEQVVLLVARLELLRGQLKATEKLRDQAVEELRDALRAAQGPTTDIDLLASMPGVGPMVLATLVSEAAPQLRDAASLRVVAGIAPVTKRSGKSCVVVMRRARSVLLSNALFHAARVATLRDPTFKALLASLRKRGLGYARALRSVSDRFLRVLSAVLRSRQPYDPLRPVKASA